MNPSVELAQVAARAAGIFAGLDLLDAAVPLLDAVGWDGRTGTVDDHAGPGRYYERGLDPAVRHTRGIHYTPLPVAGGVVSTALAPAVDDCGAAAVRVGDPACGSGAFLVAAAHELAARGAPVDGIVAGQLFGADLDAAAVSVARIEVALWSARVAGRVLAVPDDHLVVADTLTGDGAGPWGVDHDQLDVVVGNPPFGAQLKGGTVRDRGTQRLLASCLGVGALGYADTSALFLLRALDLVGPRGCVALILPTSVAAANSARSIRAAVHDRARITDVWIGGDDVGFDAAVAVWAPTFRKDDASPGPSTIRVRRTHGADFAPLDPVEVADDASTWAPLLQRAHPVPAGRPAPPVGADRGDSVASIASVSAGFRRHFYGLIPFVSDDPEACTDDPVLVTTGAIDPFHHRDDRPVRFAGVSLQRPVVDVAALAADRSMGAWVRSLAVPKVLIASQGRVLEVIVDAAGSLVPSTPVIAVVPDTDVDVWHLAAAISSPLASVRLHDEAGGTGMDGRGCRVTAGFVGALALPTDRAAWDDAADAARLATTASARGDAVTWAEQLDRLGAALVGPGDRGDVLGWWIRQRPQWRGARLLTG